MRGSCGIRSGGGWDVLEERKGREDFSEITGSGAGRPGGRLEREGLEDGQFNWRWAVRSFRSLKWICIYKVVH